MGNADGDLAKRAQESDTDTWCPYCGDDFDTTDDKVAHIEDEHL